jgi:D-alanyl-D-alanine carboxypeptidase/D-alanyl-D-alanine-endopeptidase (penicillin-binding protein 4)
MVRPRPRGTALELTGTIPLQAAATIRTIAVPNPTLYFVRAARAALEANGIEILGDAVDIDDLAQPLDRSSAVLIADFQSPPLRTLAGTMMKLSQNLFAESLLKVLGGDGTTASGRDRVRDVLAAWGIDHRDLVMVDGSGLSRYNLMTPAAQLAILSHVYGDDRLRAPFLEALPLVGVDGTLERRMIGTRAEKNARAKTGSFTNARGLAGFVTSLDGEALAFSILANNFNAPAADVDRVMDAIVVTLAQFTRK